MRLLAALLALSCLAGPWSAAWAACRDTGCPDAGFGVPADEACPCPDACATAPGGGCDGEDGPGREFLNAARPAPPPRWVSGQSSAVPALGAVDAASIPARRHRAAAREPAVLAGAVSPLFIRNRSIIR